MADNRWNHSDRDDQYPQDERPYRQNDFMGDSYYRNPQQTTPARTAADAREYFGGDSQQTENRGRHYAQPRESGPRTLERGRYMDRDSSQGIRNQDERDTYRSDRTEYDRGAGSSRSRSYMAGSDYGGQASTGRGPSYDRYGSRDHSSRAIDADLNLGSSYSTSTSFNAGPIYGEPSNYNDGQDMGAFTSSTGITRSRTRNSWGGQESFAGRGPKNYKRSDERVREDVSEALMHHHEIDASEIEVDVKDGIVTLRGEVDQRQTKRAVEDVIEAVSGVRDIRNELTINKGFFAKARDLIMGETDRGEQQKPAPTKSKH